MAGKTNTKPRLTPQGKPYSDMKHFVNADGQYLYCKYWEPAGEPKALIAVVHGMGEHCERYERIAQTLLKHDMLLFSHDHVGHGQSEGIRMDVKTFHVYVRDLLQHVDMMKSKYPNLPIYTVAHSMGGAISVHAGLDRPHEFAGMCLIAPGLHVDPRIVTPFKGGTIAILAAYERSSLFTGIVLNAPAIETDPHVVTPFKKFMAKMLNSVLPQTVIGAFKPEDVSRNEETQKLYAADPLVDHRGLKARISYQTLLAMDRIKNGLNDIRWPFLVQHGTDDKLSEISGAKLLHEKAASQDKTFTVYEGCRHEIDKELEEDANRCITEIEEWIVKRLPTQNNDSTSVEEITIDTAETAAEADGSNGVEAVGTEAVQPEITAE